MKYIDHGRGGDADVLQLAERDMPEVGAGEVLIRVAYAGVNRPDVLQRVGSYPPPRGASPWLGLEVSGVVAAVGQGVPEWKKGDRVCACVSAASIIAKVTRDRIMVGYDEQYPAYGFATHKGYVTALHRERLERLGPCAIHRLGYANVRAAARLVQS